MTNNDNTLPDTLPDAFGERWVTTMLSTILGASGDGAADTLGDLDRQSGDGDFGTNLTSAFTRAAKEVETSGPTTYTGWLTAVSRGFLGTGGTSGPLFGMFFRDLAQCTQSPAPTLTELCTGLAAGVATVQRYGKAEQGDKTMVDALIPAADELRARLQDGQDGPDVTDTGAVFDATADAAQQGALGTRDITARRGRASYVGEVARGVLDPGAAAAAIIMRCAAAASVNASDNATTDTRPVDTTWVLG